MLKLPMPGRRRGAGNPRSFTRGGIVLLGVAVAGTVLTGTAHAAEAPGTVAAATAKPLGYSLKAGPRLKAKHGFRTEWIGTLILDGKAGICDDYGLSAPDGDWNDKPSPRRPGNSRATLVEQYLINAHPTALTDSNRTAAAMKTAVNQLVSGDFAYDWDHSYAAQFRDIDPAVITMAKVWLDDAKANAGTVKVASSTTNPAPGGKGTITLAVTGNSHTLPGAKVAWKVSGATITTASKATTAKGAAVLHFTRSAGPVSYSYSVTSPDYTRAMWSRPTSGKKQHLIRPGGTMTTTGSGKFDSKAGVSVSSKCDGACDGKPPVAFSAKASDSPLQVRATGADVTKTLTVAAGKTSSAQFTGRDGITYAFSYRVQVAGKWSPWRSAKSFTVICPAAPVLTIHAICDCKGKGAATFTVTNPGGPRTYEITYDGQTQRLAATSTDLRVPVVELARAEVTWTALDSAGKRIGGGVLTPWTR